MAKVLVMQEPKYGRTYDKAVEEVCGPHSRIMYVRSLSACARQIHEGEVDAVIIPDGQGSDKTVFDLGTHLRKLQGTNSPQPRIYGSSVGISIYREFALTPGRGYNPHYANEMKERYGQKPEDLLRGWLADRVKKETT